MFKQAEFLRDEASRETLVRTIMDTRERAGLAGVKPIFPEVRLAETQLAERTDAYFLQTKEIIRKKGDACVTYAVFMRRPVLFAVKLALDWLTAMADQRNTSFQIETHYREGDWVGAGEPLFYVTGSFVHLIDLETILLQRLGPVCVAAYNAYNMCVVLPKVAFLAMEARHCAGQEMADMMAYAAHVGSEAAKRSVGAAGFIGNATTATAHHFGQKFGLGTMPHALIGYAGSTVRAAEIYHEVYPEKDLTVLVDYFGQEITDALAVCRRFPELAAAGRVAFRLDTHGSRFIEGLDTTGSYALLETYAPQSIQGYRTEAELRHLVGPGVTAAAIFHFRQTLDQAGLQAVKILASSGFGPEKCRIMAVAGAPIDVIGTGSYLPDNWSETYATADIIAYDGQPRVKLGREFLFRKPLEER